MSRIGTGIAAAIMALLASGVAAQQQSAATFDIYLRGVKAAQMGFSAIEQGGRYSAAVKMRASGFVGLLRTVSFDAKSQGRVRGSSFVPSLYEEVQNNNGNVRTARMAYRGGVPLGRELNPPRPPRDDDIDPATQGGTWDVMTTIYAIMRDVGESEVCSLNEYIFDGRRRAQIVLGSPQTRRDTITCDAEYRRIAGFNEAERAEQKVFPFRLTYERNGDGWHVTRVAMETAYGRGSMVRR